MERSVKVTVDAEVPGGADVQGPKNTRNYMGNSSGLHAGPGSLGVNTR